MRRFFFSDIPAIGEQFIASEEQSFHLSRVLRVKIGDTIEASNGSGTIFTLSVTYIDKDFVHLTVLSQQDGHEKALLSIAFISELKNDAMDQSISLLAEHGVQHIIPFFSERSIPKFDHKQGIKKQERRQKLANEVIKKVGGLYPCLVDTSISFKEIPTKIQTISQKIIFWERESTPSKNLNQINYQESHAFFIGPEGGFTDKEINLLLEWDCQCYSLGTRILRAPQAAASAASIIRYLTEN